MKVPPVSAETDTDMLKLELSSQLSDVLKKIKKTRKEKEGEMCGQPVKT